MQTAVQDDPITFEERIHVRPGDSGVAEAFLPSHCVQNHAANLCVLPDGDLGCVWFGGTQEGLPDIGVWFSRLRAGAERWSEPQKLSDDPTRSEQNPILFVAPDRRLWLLWTAQIGGNQDTAIVRYRISEDGGRSFGPIAALLDTPGTFVRQPPIVLDSGDWLLPAYRCVVTPGAKWDGSRDVSMVLITSDQGRTWRAVDVPESTGCVHMGVAQLADGSLVGLFRSRWADSIYRSTSPDRGRTWTAPVPTVLPNNNASIQFTLLASGALALVFNDASAAQATGRRTSLYDDIEDAAAADPPAASSPGSDTTPTRAAFWGAPRAPLTVALSRDGGRTWPQRKNLEVGDGFCMTNNSLEKLNREFSYPSIVQGPDGTLHVAYTYFRQRIKYARISESWIGG
jgi:predicted neuraminidase